MRISVLSAFLMLLAPIVSAQQVHSPSIGESVEPCRDVSLLMRGDQLEPKRRAVHAFECLTYIGGFVDGHFSLTAHLLVDLTLPDSKQLRLFCIPEGLPLATAVAKYVEWAERNPQLWKEDRSNGVGLALEEAFPCK